MAINANFDSVGSFLESASSEKGIFERIPKHSTLKFLNGLGTEKAIGGEVFEVSANNKKRKKRSFFIEESWLIIYRKTFLRGMKAKKMNFMNSRVDFSPRFDDHNNIKEYEIIIYKFGQKQSFFLSEDRDQYERIYNEMKKFCVLSNMKIMYEFSKKLDEGGFSKVYMMIRRQDKIAFAAKKFTKSSLEKSDSILKSKECLINEVSILRKIGGRGFYKLEEVQETRDSVYLILEMCKCELTQILPLKEAEMKPILHEILKNMLILHKNRIIHRDIKPSNIMIGHDNDVKIIDFGFATYLDDPYEKYRFRKCGTPGYVAPEILNDKKYGLSADIYSIGILIHYMLFGRTPFSSENQQICLKQNMKNDIDFSNLKYKISDSLLDLLLKMLITDDQKRITAENALNHDFFSKKEAKATKVTTTGEKLGDDSDMESVDYEVPITNGNISSIKDRPIMSVRFNHKEKGEKPVRPTYFVTPSMNLANIQDLSDILNLGVAKNTDNSISNLSSFLTNRPVMQSKKSRSSMFNKNEKQEKGPLEEK